MAQAIDVIQRALRLLGVAQTGEALQAEVAADALSVFNSLLAEWYGFIAVPEYSITAITSTLTIDDGDKEALAYQLALRLAPEFSVTLPQEFALVAQESMARLRTRYFTVGTVNFDELPNPTSSGTYWSITDA